MLVLPKYLFNTVGITFFLFLFLFYSWFLQLAFEAHDGQKRRSGEPFIIHPVEVARILGELVSHYEMLPLLENCTYMCV